VDPNLLETIETYAVFQLEQTRLHLRTLLTGQQGEEAEYGFENARFLLESGAYTLTIHDLERSLNEWGARIPEALEARVELIHAILEKYAFDIADIPEISRRIGLRTPELAEAYRQRFGADLQGRFAKHSPPDARPFWFKIPDFLQPDLMHHLRANLEWVKLPWGRTLFEQGDITDGMYIVVSGRLRIVARDEGGEETSLEEVGRGGVFGEISVLSESNRRAAGAVAIRDSELVRLSGEGFRNLVEASPQATLQFIQQVITQMSDRLKPRHRQRVHPFGTIAVIPLSEHAAIPGFMESFVEALKTHGRTFHLNSQAITDQFGEDVSALAHDDPRRGQLNWFVGAQELTNRFLVLEADPVYSAWTQYCIRMADRILLVAGETSLPELRVVEEHIYTPDFTKIAPTLELVLLYEQTDRMPAGTQDWLERRRIDRHYHVRLGDLADNQRLARHMAGRSVGIVFSGGGARGLAHVGVYRAIVEAGIPIDAVGGSSFGAIVAACVGAGWDPDLVERNMHEFVSRTRQTFRITLPMVSILDGRRLNQIFRRYFGELRIEDLWRDTVLVSSNVSRSEPHVHRTGPLWRAVRASMAIPSVFPPIVEDNELLLDGGALNNLPTDVMKVHLRGGFVIGSDCRLTQAIPDYDFEDDFSPIKLVLERLNPRGRKTQIPNLVEVAYYSSGMRARQEIERQIANTDLLIDINTDGFSLFGYERIDDLIELGYQTAVPLLEGWSAL